MRIQNVAVMTLILTLTTPVMANDDAIARAQYMLRQMNAEMVQLKASQQSLLAEKESLQKDFDQLQNKYEKLTSKSSKKQQAMSDQVSELKQKYIEIVEQHNEARKQLSEATQENDRLYAVASEQTKSIDLCVNNNKKLYEINHELLVKYENKGVWDSMTQAEPFSGLTQVQIENLVDDYQYRLDDLRVDSGL